MKEELIKLAKEKGFISDIIGKSVEAEYSTKDFYYLWMCELHKWIREVHNIHIEIKNNPHSQGNEGLWEYLTTPIFEKGHILSSLDTPFRHGNGCGLSTYEQALEKGLKESLKLIE